MHFGELCKVHKDVMVGQKQIHPGDTILQLYGPSKSVQALVKNVTADGTLILHNTPHFELPIINAGARLAAIYCPHE